MSFLPRLSGRLSPSAATAAGLLAGLAVPGDAPGGRRAPVCLREIAAGSGRGPDPAGEVAAAAGSVRVTSQVRSRDGSRRVLGCGLRRCRGWRCRARSVMSPLPRGLAPVRSGGPATHWRSMPGLSGLPAAGHPKGRTGGQIDPPATDPGIPLSHGRLGMNRPGTSAGCPSGGGRRPAGEQVRSNTALGRRS